MTLSPLRGMSIGPLADDVYSAAAVRQTRDDVGRIYEDLQSSAPAERREIYGSLPAALKSAVWTKHFLDTLARHPELTVPQRDVIQFGLTLLKSNVLDTDPSDPNRAALVDAPLQELAARAQRVFTPELAYEVFADFGSRTTPVDGAERLPAAASKTVRHPKPTTSTCECSLFSDYCQAFRGGMNGWYCSQIGGCYLSSTGCGTFWEYACNGMCVQQQDPGDG